MSDQQQRARAVFNACLRADSPHERAAIIERDCAGDDALQSAVVNLLEVYEANGSFLEDTPQSLLHEGHDPAVAATLDMPPATEQAGSKIGPYKLLQQIGEGGFGVVYMAQQTEPVRRKVALKIIKAGMDTKEVIARFEAERQALALMDHPNIAKVLDAGTTGEPRGVSPRRQTSTDLPGLTPPGSPGRPYFVMELVHGVPITEFCDENRLSTRERLELFVAVCRAVQHAHQKGIIHRDLKPSNVLITMNDDKPMPKVIDFGISKALSQQLTEKTLFTAYGQMVGTPLYMSPEQAQFTAHDVDTRSDVYSLGVLLYELLTGGTPFDKETLQKSGFDEMRRMIREVDPPRPSARISTLRAEMLSTVSDKRRIDPRKLGQSLRGELDWIVMKALEKDRNRRYESASAFAADVERYLADEAVQACPPSVGYRLRKAARRNKVALITTALVAVSLIAGMCVSIWQARRAIRSEQLAEERLKQSQRSFSQSLEAIDRMLTRVSGDLVETPGSTRIRKELYEDALDLCENLLEANPADSRVRYQAARIRSLLVFVQAELGNPPEVRRLLRAAISAYEALNAEQPENPKYMCALACAYRQLGWNGPNFKHRLKLHRRSVAILEPLVGQYPEITEYKQELVASRGALGAHLRRSDPTEALQQYQRAVALANSDSRIARGRVAGVYREYAKTLAAQGHIQQAADSFRNAIRHFQEAMKSPEIPERRFFRLCFTACYREYGRLLVKSQKLEQAEEAFQTAVQMLKRLKVDFPMVPSYGTYLFGAQSDLIKVFEQTGRTAEALRIAAEIVPRTADEYAARAKLYQASREYSKAIADYEKAVELRPGDTQRVGYLLAELARAVGGKGNYAKAIPIARRAVQLAPKNYLTHIFLAEQFLGLRRFEEALKAANQAVTLAPGESWLYKRRAEAHFYLDHYDKALADIAKAIELNPGDGSNLRWIPPDLVARCPDKAFRDGMLKLADEAIDKKDHPSIRVGRASLLRAFGRDEQALADLNKAIALNPDYYFAHYQLALASLGAGDRSACHNTCRQMLKRFAKSKDTNERHYTVWTCVLSAGAVDGYSTPIEIAERLVKTDSANAFHRQALGAILFRAGRFDEARKHLQAATGAEKPERTSPAYGWYFLAMTQQRLSQHAQAKRTLAMADRLADKELNDPAKPPTWNRKLTLELLRREATAYIGSSPSRMPVVAPRPK